MCSCTRKISETKGQSTVEGAFLIPVAFILLLLLLQPGILLYNLMVMHAAASEGCRLLATKTDAAGASAEQCEDYVKRRLGAIPPHDNFHMHSDTCSWELEFAGDEGAESVQVTIRNKAKLLPFLGNAATLLGIADRDGAVVQEVSISSATQPAWVAGSEHGLNPPAWIGDRNEP